MKVTKRDITIEDFRGRYGPLTVPKGTRVTSQTACGHDPAYNFVDEFGWVPPHDNGLPQYMLLHDLEHYGLNIPAEDVEEV